MPGRLWQIGYGLWTPWGAAGLTEATGSPRNHPLGVGGFAGVNKVHDLLPECRGVFGRSDMDSGHLGVPRALQKPQAAPETTLLASAGLQASIRSMICFLNAGASLADRIWTLDTLGCRGPYRSHRQPQKPPSWRRRVCRRQ